jgi:hypothetical protein
VEVSRDVEGITDEDLGNSNYTPIDSEDDEHDIVISTEQSSLLNESVRKYAAAGPCEYEQVQRTRKLTILD